MASTTNDAVYYLDGDSALMRLQPDGTPAFVRNLPGTATVSSSFAVSPDDKRIAISTLTYGPAPTGPGVSGPKYLGMTLYVEDLDGSHHVNLFSSRTVAEWPVGWHGSDLVIAVSSPQIGGLALDEYPYYAFAGIHVVDSSTGVRKTSLCSGLAVLGLATPAGLLCAGPGATIESDWAGHLTSTGLPCWSAHLQPGGADVACAVSGSNAFISSAGSRRPVPSPSLGPVPFTPLGWVGHDHLLLNSPYTGPVLLDVGAGTTQPVDTRGDWIVGEIPGGL